MGRKRTVGGGPGFAGPGELAPAAGAAPVVEHRPILSNAQSEAQSVALSALLNRGGTALPAGATSSSIPRVIKLGGAAVLPAGPVDTSAAKASSCLSEKMAGLSAALAGLKPQVPNVTVPLNKAGSPLPTSAATSEIAASAIARARAAAASALGASSPSAVPSLNLQSGQNLSELLNIPGMPRITPKPGTGMPAQIPGLSAQIPGMSAQIPGLSAAGGPFGLRGLGGAPLATAAASPGYEQPPGSLDSSFASRSFLQIAAEYDQLKNLDVNPQVQEFADHHKLDEPTTRSLDQELKKRKSTMEADLQSMWLVTDGAKNPMGVIMQKLREMRLGTFQGMYAIDKKLSDYAKKNDLDAQATVKLAELMLLREDPEGDLAKLEKLFERSNRPSALLMMMLKDLKDGKTIKEPDRSAAVGSKLHQQELKESMARRERSRSRKHGVHDESRGGRHDRRSDRDRGGRSDRGDGRSDRGDVREDRRSDRDRGYRERGGRDRQDDRGEAAYGDRDRDRGHDRGRDRERDGDRGGSGYGGSGY